MVAVLNQPQYQPWPMEEQVAALFAGVNGYLDDIPTEDVSRFLEELREYLRTEGTVLDAIRETNDLGEEPEQKLRESIEHVKQMFSVASEAA
jgi:F-type H+-transporting ATPase subunit alpha